MGYVKDLIGSIRKRGLFGTTRILIPEVLFDLRFGTDTFRIVALEDLKRSRNTQEWQGAHSYQAANPTLFSDILRGVISTHLRSDFSKDIFLDYGCGKGRALILAIENKMARAEGVELSPELVQVAQGNIANYLSRKPQSSAVNSSSLQVHLGNALEFDPADDVSIFFFFNPFGPEILEPVLRRLTSLPTKTAAGERLLIYMNPMHPEVPERCGFNLRVDLSPTARVYTWPKI